MPCRYYDPYHPYEENPTDKLDRLSIELDSLSALLCQFCSVVEHSDSNLMPIEVKDWWSKHQENDRLAREEEERKKAKEKQIKIEALREKKIRRKNQLADEKKEYERLKKKFEKKLESKGVK